MPGRRFSIRQLGHALSASSGARRCGWRSPWATALLTAGLAGLSGLCALSAHAAVLLPQPGAPAAPSRAALSAASDAGACVGDDTTLCLADGRFAVRVDWQTANGGTGAGHPRPITANSGAFWFFQASNLELLVKVIDACGETPPHRWVFAAGLTNVATTLVVTDTVTGAVRRYQSPAGAPFAPLQDTNAFNCAATTPEATIELVSDAPGWDWTLPASVVPEPGTGFFSENATPELDVTARVVDLTWRQLQPEPGVFSTTTADRVYGMDFPSFATQLADDGPYWLRLWITGRDWAPPWVQDRCGVTPVGVGYEGDPHLPIWNACLWNHARDLWRTVLIGRGLRSDPRLVLAYVPGGFTWSEFDFDIPAQAAADGKLAFTTFSRWFEQAIADLVAIANGENDDPGDDFAHKLVYTGEDYPFGPSGWGTRDDLLARDAVAAGMGIRTGISELSNFHLNEIPAWGTTIGADGHLVTDPHWVGLDGRRVLAAENECFDACGFTSSDREYAVRMANLKVLQMGVRWLYVVPEDSFLTTWPAHWRWVRLGLGRRAETAPDAWVALREAGDRYFLDDPVVDWSGRPWIRNLERFLRQIEPPGARTRRGSEVHVGELSPDNGTAFEGRRTQLADGQSRIAFVVDDAFLDGSVDTVELFVTYRDDTNTGWRVKVSDPSGTPVLGPELAQGRTGAVRTARLRLQGVAFSRALAGGGDLELVATGDEDLEVLFVRLVRPVG